jgi:hypothetical protein
MERSGIGDHQARSARPRPVCVLTAGRSGSSLAARAINLLGVHLGAEEEMMGATEQNERGFWENLAIYRLNEEILGLLGGSWYQPPKRTAEWACDERFEELRARAAGIVGDLELAGRRWGFKDPRTIVLLPFWRQIVGEMDYLICVRRAHPFVRSVEALAPPGGAHVTAGLWLDMNAAALAQTVDARRMFVFYEDWFEDPCRVAGQVAAFIHGDAGAAEREVLDAVVAFIDPMLRRADSHGEAAELAQAPELEAMYAHLRLAAELDGEGPEARGRHAVVAQALADGYRLRQGLQENLQEVVRNAAASRAETETARARASALEQANDELATELARERERLQVISDSTSWRVTAPLRVARRQVKGRLDRRR